jgi:ParB-like chromosome segregation protein Spo0J
MKIKLQDIIVSQDLQSRDSIDEQVVKQYAESIKEGAKFPPVILFDDGSNHYLVDGFHRYFAYLMLGVEETESIVHKGTLRQAELFSWGVNDKHGQPRSNATKRFLVLRALDDLEFSDKSAREIAELVHLSHTYVNKVIAESKEPKKQADQPAKQKQEKPVKLNTVVEAPLEDDNILKELADLNKELHEENQKYKDIEMVLDSDQSTTLSEIDDLRKKINTLEMELTAVKNTRDQLQSKNAELIKSVNYWKKKYEKIAS